MQAPPITHAEIEARIADHVDELLGLWHAEQGGEIKARGLRLMASSLPFPRENAISALDLCCGPGDVGRAIVHEYPNARVDCIDRDPFLAALCAQLNRRSGIPGKIVVRDINGAGWKADVSRDYDVVATANALHQFNATGAERLIQDVHGLLRAGGVFLLAEPVSAENPFAPGIESWSAALPQRYTRDNWQRLWSRATTILGYNPVALWARASNPIDVGMTVAGWISLLDTAGFELHDVLLRDADEVVIAAMKLK